jgi:hypothetical protein
VKKRLELLSFVATVAVVFALGSWLLTSWKTDSLGTVAQAQQTTPSQQPTEPPSPRPQNQVPQQTQPPAQSGQAQPGESGSQPSAAEGHEFVGTIVKQGNKYMFQDASTGQMYGIDHQDEVKKFEGKKVRVRGTLDLQTKTIHVQ